MKMIRDIEAVFEKFSGEYLEFEKIENKLSQRPDLHAFLLLDSLVSNDRDIISASEHDEYYLSVNPDELAKVATEENIRDLIRCGVRYSDESLCMFS
jgi:hypothetical protein